MNKKHHDRLASAAGFSLVELLIAIVILMVGIVSVAQLIPAAMRTNTRNRFDSSSLILAQRQLELLSAQDLRIGCATIVTVPVTFCLDGFLPDGTPATYALGQDSGVGGLAPLAPPPNPLTFGAPVVLGTLTLDWTANRVLNYFNLYTNPEGFLYETRWSVTVFYGNINGFVRPVGKRIILATRGGPPGMAMPPTTLVTVVGWRND